MPFTLAVAGLSSAEQAALVEAIKNKASLLSVAWTLLWNPDDFPERPDALLYCPKHDEGKLWAERLGKTECLLLAALPPHDTTPSEVPLFVRMPFNPQEIIDALNVAARRIRGRLPEEPASSPQGDIEERVEIMLAARGAARVDPLALVLYAVFRTADKDRFYKIRQTQSAPGCPLAEIWCWPDLGLYWCALAESDISGGMEAVFEVFNCPGKRDALRSKTLDLRRSGALLWRAGTRAFKTAELLPWFQVDAKMMLTRWPELPLDARGVALIRILSRLTRAEATFGELLAQLRTTRKDLAMVVNGLVMSGDLVRSLDPRALLPEPEARVDPEQALFLSALGLRCAENLSDAINLRLEMGAA